MGAFARHAPWSVVPSSDTESWKSVHIFRGLPADPRLHADSASQVGQDLTIADIFGRKRGGTFVDLASNDAISLSNSLTLEQKYGWSGLCVEPNPAYAEGYVHRMCRLVQAVVGPEEGAQVEFNFRGAFGGIMGFDNKQSNATQKHYTVSLGKILQDFGMPTTIDYLSLDIEGAEAWALSTFPWDKFTFQAVTVERPKEELKATLQAHNYVHMCNHGGFGDELWVHRSLPQYAQVAGKYQGRRDCRTA
jgi:hypothetical protein